MSMTYANAGIPAPARLTRRSRRVLLALLPGLPLTGSEIRRLACTGPLSTHAVLARLADAGWVIREQVAEGASMISRAPYDPFPQAFYRLTPEGHLHALRVLGLRCQQIPDQPV